MKDFSLSLSRRMSPALIAHPNPLVSIMILILIGNNYYWNVEVSAGAWLTLIYSGELRAPRPLIPFALEKVAWFSLHLGTLIQYFISSWISLHTLYQGVQDEDSRSPTPTLLATTLIPHPAARLTGRVWLGQVFSDYLPSCYHPSTTPLVLNPSFPSHSPLFFILLNTTWLKSFIWFL